MNPPLNMKDHVNEIKHTLKPPVSNSLLHNGKIKVMFVGGPNARPDYHIEMGEELFYMIKGHMDLDIVVNNTKQRVRIPEDYVFLLPSGIPHSPQRYADTVGLVFERDRLKDEIDCMRWYVPCEDDAGSTKTLCEEFFHCTDLGIQLKPMIEEYNRKMAAGIAFEPIKTDMELVPQERALMSLTNEDNIRFPFSLSERISQHNVTIDEATADITRNSLLDSEFKFEVLQGPKRENRETPAPADKSEASQSSLGPASPLSDSYASPGASSSSESSQEYFLWQHSGRCKVLKKGQSEEIIAELAAGDTILLQLSPSEVACISIVMETRDDCVLLVSNENFHSDSR